MGGVWVFFGEKISWLVAGIPALCSSTVYVFCPPCVKLTLFSLRGMFHSARPIKGMKRNLPFLNLFFKMFHCFPDSVRRRSRPMVGPGKWWCAVCDVTTKELWCVCGTSFWGVRKGWRASSRFVETCLGNGIESHEYDGRDDGVHGQPHPRRCAHRLRIWTIVGCIPAAGGKVAQRRRESTV